MSRSQQVGQDKWLVHLKVGGSKRTFRIDTGARCNVLVASTHRKLRNQGTLRRSRKSLYSYSNHKISSHGVAKIPVKCKGIQLEADFEVVDLEQENIISGELAEQLGLIQRVNKVADRTGTETRPPPELDAFPDLANVTGTLPGTYTIKIDPSAQGVVHPDKETASDASREDRRETERDGE